jgi:hypothetical protein
MSTVLSTNARITGNLKLNVDEMCYYGITMFIYSRTENEKAGMFFMIAPCREKRELII